MRIYKIAQKYFTVSVYKDESACVENDSRPGWTKIEEDIPQFKLRDLVRQLYDEGYAFESILVEVQK